MSLKNKTAGFTLIELLVVIAIVGLLASVVLVSLAGSRAKARDGKRLADIAQLATAFSLYHNNCGSYPQTSAVVLNASLSLFSGTATNCGVNDGTGTNGGIGSAVVGSTYLSKFPSAPAPPDNGTLAVGSLCSEANGTGKVWNDYIYTSTSSGTYTVTFCLGAKAGSQTAGRHTLTEVGIR